MNFFGGVGHVTSNIWLDFGGERKKTVPTITSPLERARTNDTLRPQGWNGALSSQFAAQHSGPQGVPKTQAGGPQIQRIKGISTVAFIFL